MPTFSKYFSLNKSQSELDFVDVDLNGDIPLYVDPFAFSARDDEWSKRCEALIQSFFEAVLKAVRNNKERQAILLLSQLNEPSETHLGVSQDGNSGRGIGSTQAKELFDSLKRSQASKTGVLNDLSDLALYIPGIGRDKISDITTNIIRGELIEYTASQCSLHTITMHSVPSGPCWKSDKERWEQSYVSLPVCNGAKVLLVPKYSVRYQVGVDHAKYRNKFVLEYLQAEHLRADDGLVSVLKNKKRVVYKKTVDEHYPKTKDFLATFSASHPDVIESYKQKLKEVASRIPNITDETITEALLAGHLESQLASIPPGVKDATAYHNLMIGIVSFLFFPNLMYPIKEHEVNQGRKRIDILYTNGKEDGLFYRLALDPAINPNCVHVECKNYNSEIANAEFDQLLGRFDRERGKFGMLFFRKSKDLPLAIQRSRDAAKQGLGIALPMDDTFVVDALKLIKNGQRESIDRLITDLYIEVTS